MNPNRLLHAFMALKNKIRYLLAIEHHIHDLKMTIGQSLASRKAHQSNNIQDYEFKIFSQWGEDGIIQKLINSVEINNKTFIEFGVEDFKEANCRFLLENNNWSGFIMDGSQKNIKSISNSYIYWKYDIKAKSAFIDKDNIELLLHQSNMDYDIGILSIDIDGMDYFVWDSIKSYHPRIVIAEYNSVFGPDRSITVPYDANFIRTAKNHTNLYFGASLAALTNLAVRKGYTLVGVNSAGANAFFVRNDLMNDALKAMTAKEAYVESKFRESRHPDGSLSYLSGKDRLEAIRGLPVLNIETGEIEAI